MGKSDDVKSLVNELINETLDTSEDHLIHDIQYTDWETLTRDYDYATLLDNLFMKGVENATLVEIPDVDGFAFHFFWFMLFGITQDQVESFLFPKNGHQVTAKFSQKGDHPWPSGEVTSFRIVNTVAGNGNRVLEFIDDQTDATFMQMQCNFYDMRMKGGQQRPCMDMTLSWRKDQGMPKQWIYTILGWTVYTGILPSAVIS